MKNFKKEYYEQSIFWDQDYLQNPAEKERIKQIINAIPHNTHTVLDVGCGNSAFLNTLTSTFPDRFGRVVGFDSSKEALKYVKTEKTYGTVSDLPFKGESFDLVTSLEVLEHLTQEDFKKGVSELQRVSKKYIIITVPNDQDLERSLVICPKCHCWFNPCFHIRSFKRDTLSNLFKNFSLIKIKELGPISKYYSYNTLLVTFYLALARPIPPETAICPQCGYQYKDKEKTDNLRNNNSFLHFVSKVLFSFKPLVKLILHAKRKKRWLLALYEKADR